MSSPTITRSWVATSVGGTSTRRVWASGSSCDGAAVIDGVGHGIASRSAPQLQNYDSVAEGLAGRDLVSARRLLDPSSTPLVDASSAPSLVWPDPSHSSVWGATGTQMGYEK